MILHIFTQVSDYCVEFLKLVAGNFPPGEHLVVFRSAARRNQVEDKFPMPMLFLENRNEMIRLMPPLLVSADRIIFHSFPVSRSLVFWWKYRKHFGKAIWSVWGQDAYWFRYCRKTPENILYEFLRKRLIKRLPLILCPIPGDYKYILKKYGTRAKHHEAMYPIPTDFEFLNTLRNSPPEKSTLHIQVGNSANPTNNTPEVLAFLKRHLQQDFKVFCPLSYGDNEYAKLVIDYGTRELGNHFVPLTSFMDKTEYARFVASIDVLIMNHERQQGLGNIFSYLFLGKKVYIRKDNSSFGFFREKQICVYDTTDLMRLDRYDELSELDTCIAAENIKFTLKLISLEEIAKNWHPILNLRSRHD
jgi:hypothetical protein